ncbi:hypothetical protein GQ597_01900 [Gilliamella sp. Pra-s65]|uniref:hypothetical protein n=1 Tax=unclassified Gilliamella TaxID=2685620 RepID=UPI0013660AA9|nr:MULTISPECIES: hypothetical protein [unclassified Gilliamella]MWN89467.1 hypothetical protein [Gilliamella sp. Pra-s65]MWP72781.1 hypothetical protein [Gilliamella sp. Pra-s52]
MVQVLLAKMQGVQVEYKIDGNWRNSDDDTAVRLYLEYRIAPQLTPLPISREIWAMIAPKWKWAAMDKDGEVYFYTDKPYINTRDIGWANSGGDYCGSALATNTDDINWRLSLTERPEGV